jgi:hypothetical protein
VNGYTEWIAANVPANPRGLCRSVTEQMQAAFPELRRVRGFFESALDAKVTHWWLETVDGQVVDPTAAQFQTTFEATYAAYAGPDPMGQCANCGELIWADGGYGSTFCDDECAGETFEDLKAGGTLYIDGERIY